MLVKLDSMVGTGIVSLPFTQLDSRASRNLGLLLVRSEWEVRNFRIWNSLPHGDETKPGFDYLRIVKIKACKGALANHYVFRRTMKDILIHPNVYEAHLSKTG